MNFARGGGGGRQSSNHLPILFGKHDRFCVWCGGLIPRQVQQKTVTCPHEGCRKPLPLRQGTWTQRNVTGMGRCPLCDSFVHKSFLYCQMCKNANEEGLAKRNEANTRALAEERESNKRLKLELDQLKAERERERLMDVDADNLIVAAVMIEGAAGNQGGAGAAGNQGGAGAAGNQGGAGAEQIVDPLAGINEEDLLDDDDDL